LSLTVTGFLPGFSDFLPGPPRLGPISLDCAPLGDPLAVVSPVGSQLADPVHRVIVEKGGRRMRRVLTRWTRRMRMKRRVEAKQTSANRPAHNKKNQGESQREREFGATWAYGPGGSICATEEPRIHKGCNSKSQEWRQKESSVSSP